MRKGVTIHEATERWVSEMNAFPYGMIERLMKLEPDEWYEVTVPSNGDRVYVYGMPDGCEDYNRYGEIENHIGNKIYLINLDDGNTVEVGQEDFEVQNDGFLPMWGWLWQFADSADDYWLEEMDGIQIMSDCGFRIYHNEEFGYFFGIDGCGYDFYEAHWIPLYKKRGLQWHDPELLDESA